MIFRGISSPDGMLGMLVPWREKKGSIWCRVTIFFKEYLQRLEEVFDIQNSNSEIGGLLEAIFFPK